MPALTSALEVDCGWCSTACTLAARECGVAKMQHVQPLLLCRDSVVDSHVGVAAAGIRGHVITVHNHPVRNLPHATLQFLDLHQAG